MPGPRVVALALSVVCCTAAPAAENKRIVQARADIAAGRYDQALERLDDFLQFGFGNLATARALRVRVWLETGKYQKAGREAAALARSAPDAAALTLLAETLIETGGYGEAGKQLVAAQKADRNHVRAHLLSLLLAEITGDRDGVETETDFFFGLYNDDKADTAEAITAVGRAVQEEAPHDAFRAYGEAMKTDPSYLDAYYFSAEFAYGKYSWKYAHDDFKKILDRNPKHAAAHAGLAAVFLANSKYDEAQASIKKALETNPNRVDALLLRAQLADMDDKQEESLKNIRTALAVNPASPDALAMLAAYHDANSEPDERDKAIAKALKINPHGGDAYLLLAFAAERRRQFPAAVAWARKAIRTDPNDWQGYHMAGMNLMRIGEEAEGYRLLDRAWKGDPDGEWLGNKFNLWLRNMLHVLDKDVKKKLFAYHETEHFFVKLEHKEDQILWPYIEPMIEAAYAKYTKRYDIAPTGPKQFQRKILFLMFSRHDDFSARTVGLPGLGALGACFGQVVTMPSPRFAKEHPGGAFNWKRVFEHEFVHVLTLQKTNYHIPRWFTEGISTWEEQDPQIKWDRLLKSALADDKLLPLEDINIGFSRPKFPQQVVLSYYHASLICGYLDKNYGFAAIRRMLDLYRAGKGTKEVLETVTGKSLKTLNEEVLAHIRAYAEAIHWPAPPDKEKLKELEENVDEGSADALAELAAGLLAHGRGDDARNTAEKALALDADHARANGILGFLAFEGKDFRKAKDRFQRAVRADPEYFFARLFLGLLYEKEGENDAAIAQFEKARRIYPRFQKRGQSPHLHLADLYEKEKQPASAIKALRDLTVIDNTSLEGFTRLGRLLAAQGRHREAAAALLEAVYINPYQADVHLDAGRAYEKAGMNREALREFRVAVALEPRDVDALLGQARTAASAGRAKEARAALDALHRVDPDNEEAKRIRARLDR